MEGVGGVSPDRDWYVQSGSRNLHLPTLSLIHQIARQFSGTKAILYCVVISIETPMLKEHLTFNSSATISCYNIVMIAMIISIIIMETSLYTK